MARIDELIAELCPDGVEYKPLSTLCKISRGRVISKKYIHEHSGEYPVYSSQTLNDGNLGGIDSYDYDGEYLTWTTDGANAGSVFHRSGCFSITNVCGLLDRLPDSDVILRYLYYWLTYDLKRHVSSGMGNPKLMSNVVANVKVPVPPVELQEEIVRILDSFSALEAELERTLEAELEARKKQYAYYRDQILSFTGSKVKWLKLGDLFEFKNGLNKEKSAFGRGFPIVNYKDVYQGGKITEERLAGLVDVEDSELKRYSVELGDVFFTRTSETKEEIGLSAVVVDSISQCVFSGFLLRGRPITNLLLPEYCAYCFSTYDVRRQIVKYATLTTRALTNGRSLSKVVIPVPPIEEQKRIVTILDNFDALVNDLSAGLPAELEARRKQYEHYRDRLLSFPVKQTV